VILEFGVEPVKGTAGLRVSMPVDVFAFGVWSLSDIHPFIWTGGEKRQYRGKGRSLEMENT
jgi:hypothetical protein